MVLEFISSPYIPPGQNLLSLQAKERCNGLELDGRKIRVDYSITKRAHTPTPGVYMGKPTRSSYDERGGGGGGGGRYDDDDYHDRGKEREGGREREWGWEREIVREGEREGERGVGGERETVGGGREGGWERVRERVES